MATGETRPPSHFPTSLYQFRTRLEGDTTMALSISGLASGLWRSSVHMRAMHCSVFPRPISSAMMQPCEPEMRLPVTHSHRNRTPSEEKTNAESAAAEPAAPPNSLWIPLSGGVAALCPKLDPPQHGREVCLCKQTRRLCLSFTDIVAQTRNQISLHSQRLLLERPDKLRL